MSERGVLKIGEFFPISNLEINKVTRFCTYVRTTKRILENMIFPTYDSGNERSDVWGTDGIAPWLHSSHTQPFLTLIQIVRP